MNDDQLEKAARWLCVQRGKNPSDSLGFGLGSEPIERWCIAADEIKAHIQLHQAASIALGTPGDTVQIKREPPRGNPAPDDVTRVRSENARRFDRILEDVEANKVPTWALQAAARAWCEDSTRMIEMDSRLAIEFAKSLVAERRRCAKAVEAVLERGKPDSVSPSVRGNLTKAIRSWRDFE